LGATKCQQCEKTSRDCKCDLPKERNIQDELASAMASYRGAEKVKSISHLTALMAGGGSSEKRCVYDNKLKKWIPRKFEPLPKGNFEWECLSSGSKGTTEFVLDSGSQLNLLPMSEIRDQGIDVNSLPRIDLNVIGV
jgi:hypothetical protein